MKYVYFQYTYNTFSVLIQKYWCHKIKITYSVICSDKAVWDSYSMPRIASKNSDRPQLVSGNRISNGSRPICFSKSCKNLLKYRLKYGKWLVIVVPFNDGLNSRRWIFHLSATDVYENSILIPFSVVNSIRVSVYIHFMVSRPSPPIPSAKTLYTSGLSKQWRDFKIISALAESWMKTYRSVPSHKRIGLAYFDDHLLTTSKFSANEKLCTFLFNLIGIIIQ